MRIKIGIIAEDWSDYEVFKKIFKKVRPDIKFSFEKFLGGGCGRIRSKCSKWADNLIVQGCSYIVLFHDLDRNSLKKLRGDLETSLGTSSDRRRLVVIPIEELEAWLLADVEAIAGTFEKVRKVPKIGNPESIKSPKEFLEKLVYKHSGKTVRYINTDHNELIADKLNIRKLANFVSFKPLNNFLAGL